VSVSKENDAAVGAGSSLIRRRRRGRKGPPGTGHKVAEYHVTLHQVLQLRPNLWRQNTTCNTRASFYTYTQSSVSQEEIQHRVPCCSGRENLPKNRYLKIYRRRDQNLQAARIR
jgi:hypothetical protein